jgi:hypothetical protein
MSKLSRSVPITLYHNYRQIPFSTVEACQSCFPQFDGRVLLNTNPTFPLINSIHKLDQGSGVTMDQLFSAASSLVPEFTEDDYDEALQLGIKNGIFRALQAPYINYFVTQPPCRYILSPDLDRHKNNETYVKFLLSLVGGYTSPTFTRWFAPSPSCYNSSTGSNPCVACF